MNKARTILLGSVACAIAWAPAFGQGVDIVTTPPIVFPGADGGRQFVALEATQIFWDDFGTGTLDTTNRWSTPTTGGGGNAVAATNAVGATVLSSGTQANGFSLLTSQATFPGRNPGYITGQWQVNIPFPAPTGAFSAWGWFTNPGTPTAAAPLTNAVVFAINSSGKLRAQTWASGSINVDIDLSINQSGPQLCNCVAQPPDAAVHKYQITFRGDNILWWMDGRLVAKVVTGAGGPDVNTLPTAALAVVGTSGITTASTVQLNQVTLGDTSRNNTRICDATFGWRCATVGAFGTLGASSGSFPSSATPIQGNATGTTGAVVGTLAAAAGKTTYLCDFDVSALGTANTVGPIVVAGLLGGSKTFQASTLATGTEYYKSEHFNPCLPGSAVNTAITITTTAAAGGTAVDVNSSGYQQ